MSILCALFGHMPPCYKSCPGGEYAVLQGMGDDGIGRRHARLIAECPRCGEKYEICKTHIPNAEDKVFVEMQGALKNTFENLEAACSIYNMAYIIMGQHNALKNELAKKEEELAKWRW